MAPRKVTPPPRGIWGLVARAQRVGLSEGMRGKGGPWLALGIGAWGLQRVRSMAKKDTEILISEPLGPGQRIVITNEGITRAQDQRQQQQTRKEAKAAAKEAKRVASRRGQKELARREAEAAAARARAAELAARRARKRLRRAERADHDAHLAAEAAEVAVAARSGRRRRR